MTVGEKIKKLRKDRNISQKDLAVLAGIPVVTLQQYERGVRTQPRIEQLRKIAIALNVPISFLLGAVDSSTDSSFSSTALEWAIQENLQQENEILQNKAEIEDRAKRTIEAAMKEHCKTVMEICTSSRPLTEAQRLREQELMHQRILTVTEFVERNFDFLRKNMPGMTEEDLTKK